MLRQKQEMVAMCVHVRASDRADGNSTTCARDRVDTQVWNRIWRNDPRPLSSQPLGANSITGEKEADK